MKLEYKIKEYDIDKTINQILTTNLNISTRLLSKLIRNNQILLNHKQCDTRNKSNLGDIVTIDFCVPENNSNIVPTKMDLSILYEDEWFFIIDKPANMPIHPSRLHYDDSLSNGVKFYFDSIRISQKNTSYQSSRSRHFWFSYFCQVRIYTRMFYSTNA